MNLLARLGQRERVLVGQVLVEQRHLDENVFYYWVASTDPQLRTGSWTQLAEGRISVAQDIATDAPVKIELYDQAATRFEALLTTGELEQMSLSQLIERLAA